MATPDATNRPEESGNASRFVHLVNGREHDIRVCTCDSCGNRLGVDLAEEFTIESAFATDGEESAQTSADLTESRNVARLATWAAVVAAVNESGRRADAMSRLDSALAVR